MKRLLIGLLCLSLPGVVHARLGENEGQLAARYGAGSPPSRQSQAMGVMDNNRFYHAQSYDITVVLGRRDAVRAGKSAAGLSVSESFSSGGKMSPKFVSTLLDANKGDSQWEGPSDEVNANGVVIGRFWRTKDGTREARLRSVDVSNDSFWVVWNDVKESPKGF